VQAEVLLQVQFELPTQAVAAVKVEHDVGVPLQFVPVLHWHIALVWQAVADVNVLQAVGVPVQVPPAEAQSQL
jgi:hypothetical protein